MTNLKILNNFWSNIEQSYQSVTNGRIPRMEFLKETLAYSEEENKTRADYLIDLLSDDISYYSEEDMDKYLKLISRLKEVDHLLTSKIYIDDNKDFGDIFKVATHSDFESKKKVKSIEDKYIIGLTCAKISAKKHIEMSLENIMDTFGTLGEVFFKDVHYLVQPNTKDYFVYRNESSILKIKDMLNDDTRTFLSKVVYTKQLYASHNELPKSLIFLGSSYFSKKGETLIVKIGSFVQTIKIDLSNKIKIKNGEVYYVDLKLKDSTVSVVLAES